MPESVRTPTGQAHKRIGLQPAPRSLERSPGLRGPSYRSVPLGGRSRVLFGERLCTRRNRFTHFTIPFALLVVEN